MVFMLSSVDAINGDPTGSVTSTCNFPCSPISDLVDCLLMEILCRIRSEKSLIGCKCVSKRWFNLVSSPFFVRHRFLNHHGGGHPTKPSPSPIQHNLSLLKMDPKESRFWFRQLDLPRFKALRHMGLLPMASHYDLLLCSLQIHLDAVSFDSTNFCIYNPFTMDFIVFPPAPDFDSELQPTAYFAGAGLLVKYNCSEKVEDKCDGTSNQLQFWVVRLRRQREKVEIVADIYSSESGMWKESVLSGSHVSFLKFAVVRNDKLHWVMDSMFDKSQDTKVIAYDPSTMECQYIPVPKIDDKLRDYIVGPCCGFLRLVAAHYHDSKQDDGLAYMVIWELKNPEVGEWSLMHKIYFNEMVCKMSLVQKFARSGSSEFARSGSFQWLRLLAIEEKDRNNVYMNIRGYTVSCDLQKKELEVVGKDQKMRSHRIVSLVLQQQPTPLRDNFHFKPSSQSTSLEHAFKHLQITKLCSE